MDNASIFSSPEAPLPLEPTSPTTPPPLIPKEEKTSPLYYIIIAVLVLALCVTTFFLVRTLFFSSSSSTSSVSPTVQELTKNPSSYTPSDSASVLRRSMYSAFVDARASGFDESSLINLLDEWIAYADSEDTGISLSIFATYLLLSAGYSDNALSHYNTLVSTGAEYTSNALCELAEYRLLIAYFRNPNSSALETYALNQATACASAPVGDGTFATAEALFYSGYYSSAIASFRNMDLSTLDSSQQTFALYLLRNHYAIISDITSYNVINNQLTSLLNSASTEEGNK